VTATLDLYWPQQLHSMFAVDDAFLVRFYIHHGWLSTGARDGEHAAGDGRGAGLLAASFPGGPVALAEGHGPQHDLQVSAHAIESSDD